MRRLRPVRRAIAGDPGKLTGMQRCCPQRGMIVPLNDIQDIARHLLFGHEPGGMIASVAALASFDATDVQSFALAERVKGQPVVFAQQSAVVKAANLTLARRQVTHQKFLERTFADETDAGRILLECDVQRCRRSQGAHIPFEHPGQRKQGARELRLIEAMQKIALILRRIRRLEQLEFTVRAMHGIHLTDARVMAGSDLFGAQPHRMIEKGLELDF